MNNWSIVLDINRQISEVKKLIELWLGKEVSETINIFFNNGELKAVTNYFTYIELGGRQNEHIDKIFKLIILYHRNKFSYEQILEWIKDDAIDSLIERVFKKKEIV